MSWNAELFFRFLKIKIENEAEQQMFCGLIRNTCLLSCRNAHSNGCELLIWLGDKIQNRRSDYGSLNTHQSQWRLQPEYLSFTDQTVHWWRLTEILYLSKCISPLFYINLFGFSSFYLYYECLLLTPRAWTEATVATVKHWLTRGFHSALRSATRIWVHIN